MAVVVASVVARVVETGWKQLVVKHLMTVFRHEPSSHFDRYVHKLEMLCVAIAVGTVVGVRSCSRCLVERRPSFGPRER